MKGDSIWIVARGMLWAFLPHYHHVQWGHGVCAGIAMMSQGLTSCGLDLKATNDLQETIVAYQGKVRVM